MPFRKGGGRGGEGGGLHFRDPVDEFATTAARNTAFEIGGTLDGEYEEFVTDRFLAIVIGTIANPTSFQTYVGDNSGYDDAQWVNRADAVLLKGDIGDTGPQSRFVIIAYANGAAAPVTPVGGTYTRSTGVLALPAGITSVPSTPAAGQITFRTFAVINPAVDVNIVNLTWSAFSEDPVWTAAELAEVAQTAAETAQAHAEDAQALAEQAAGQAQDIPAGSPRGALIATSPTLPTAAVGTNTVIAFGAAELWTLSAAGTAASFAAGEVASNERLYLPDIHSAGSNGIWIVIEVNGLDIAEVFISQGGIQGATGADRRHIIPVSLTTDALVRVGFWPRSGATASYIQITGNSDTLLADTVVKVYFAVVRGAAGPGGGGPGGTNETNLAVANRDADSLDVTSDTGTDATLPSANAAEAGLQSAADKTKLDAIADGAQVNVGVTFSAADKAKLDAIAAGATAVSITDVLAVVLAGTNITIDRTTAGQITIASSGGGTPDPGDHTRRAAISEDTTLETTEVAAGTSSNSATVTTPMWGNGVYRTLFIGVPQAEDDISDILFNGLSQFSNYVRYQDVSNNDIIVEAHKWWYTVDLDGEYYSEIDLEIDQT